MAVSSVSKYAWIANKQNVLAEHDMFEKFGGGETSKQGQAAKSISCQANNVGQFLQCLLSGTILSHYGTM